MQLLSGTPIMELRYAYRFRHTGRVFRSADRADQSHFGKDAS